MDAVLLKEQNARKGLEMDQEVIAFREKEDFRQVSEEVIGPIRTGANVLRCHEI